MNAPVLFNRPCVMRRALGPVLICSTVLPLSVQAADAVAKDVSQTSLSGLDLSQIPEEFRDLAGPQTTVADFYYGDRYLISATVTYTPATIRIADPAALVSRIHDIAVPNTVIAAITGDISSHPDYVCPGRAAAQCKPLEPRVAGVVFDADNFRADLFVAESYLQTQTLFQSKYLPASDSSLGMLQGLSMVASGAKGDREKQTNYSLFGNTLVGWRENHLVASWDHNKDKALQVDTFFLERDANGLQLGAGYIDYGGVMATNFASGKKVLGLKAGSSMNSRVDIADVNATPVKIFTNGRRRVEILRDNRLVYATTVDAGSQELDTRSLPQGAYDITIRIYDGSVLVQEVKRFYTKSIRLPPSDELLWYVEGGDITERDKSKTLPQGLGKWLVRGGLAHRLINNASVEGRAIATEDEQVFEAELFYLGNGWDANVTGMLAAQGGKGASIDVQTSIGPLNVGYQHRRLWHKRFRAGTGKKTRLLGAGSDSRILSLNTGFMGGNLSASYNYNKADNDDRAKTIYSASWFHNLFRFSDYDLDLQLNYSAGEDDKIASVSLSLRYNGSNWNYNVQADGRREQRQGQTSQSSHGYALDSRWHQDDILGGAGDIGLRYENLSDDQTLLGGDLKYDQSRFRADLSVDRISTKSRRRFVNYTGRVDTSFALNTAGVGFGGGHTANSAVLVSIDGSPAASFDVLVNGGAAGIAQGDSTTVVPLNPYGVYRVGIRPRGTDFHNYDQNEHAVTLYPGNVETLTFSSEEELVLLGKLVSSRGEALRHALISVGADSTRTDDFGIFQVRMSAQKKQLEVTLDNNEICIAALPDTYQKRAGVGLVGVLECR